MIGIVEKFQAKINHLINLKNQYEAEHFLQIQKILLEIRNQLQVNQIQKSNQIEQFLLHYQMFNVSIKQVCQGKLAQKINNSKILMYYFQVLNFITIYCFQNKPIIITNFNTLQNITFIVRGIITNQSLFYQKSIKAFLVYLFNFIKNTKRAQKKLQILSVNQLFLLTLLKESINYIFAKYRLQTPSKQGKDTKSQSYKDNIYKDNIQWLCFLIQGMIQLYLQLPQKNGFIQVYFHFLKQQNNTNFLCDQFELLHLIGNIYQQIIQSRSTTQLIFKYGCPLDSVKELYNRHSNSSNLKIQISDYCYLLSVFQKYFDLYKTAIKGIITSNKQQQTEVNNQQEKLQGIQENIIQMLRILNCILFLGGYNASIQQVATKQLLSNNKPTLALLLEISYIIYAEQQSFQRSKRKIQLVKVPKSNLFSLMNFNSQIQMSEQQQNIVKLQICKKLIPGQLSSILRLLTNLVHINGSAQQFFQQNVKYLHIILSLTHQSQIQMTMKQWAIMFIKNCCQSQKIRNQIDKVKITMKVDQGQ